MKKISSAPRLPMSSQWHNIYIWLAIVLLSDWFEFAEKARRVTDLQLTACIRHGWKTIADKYPLPLL